MTDAELAQVSGLNPYSNGICSLSCLFDALIEMDNES